MRTTLKAARLRKTVAYALVERRPMNTVSLVVYRLFPTVEDAREYAYKLDMDETVYPLKVRVNK